MGNGTNTMRWIENETVKYWKMEHQSLNRWKMGQYCNETFENETQSYNCKENGTNTMKCIENETMKLWNIEKWNKSTFKTEKWNGHFFEMIENGQ